MNDFLKDELEVSNEAISQQFDTDFTDQLDGYITSISNNIRNKIVSPTKLKRHPDVVGIIDLIKKRFGFKISIDTVDKDAIIAAIYPPFFTATVGQLADSSDFKLPKNEEELSTYLNKKLMDKGFEVDRDKAYIKGIDNTTPIRVIMNFHYLINEEDSSPRELASIFMHEIGHGFTYFETVDGLSKTSQSLLPIFEEVVNKKDISKKEVFKLANTFEDENDKKDLKSAASKSKTVLSLVLLKTVYRNTKIVLRNSNEKYSKASSEVMADQFATRFGYGKELSDALIGLPVDGAYVMYQKLRLISFVVILLLATLGKFSFIVYIFGGLNYVAAYIVYTVLFTKFFLYDFVPYDMPQERINRIRKELTNRLKYMDKKDRKKLEIEIEAIKKLEEQIKDIKDEPLEVKIINRLFSTTRSVIYAEKVEQLLDELGNNRLTVSQLELELALTK